MIFITGCNGLLGSFIARKLVSEGQEIYALKRPHSDLSLLAGIENSIHWIEGDIFDLEVLNKAMTDCDTVIHAAAVISFSPRRREDMYRVNVQGTANVVNAALQNKIKKFCYISSIAALGRKKNEPEVTEESLWEESELNTHYARSKYMAELEVWRGKEEGLPVFAVNPSVVIGPGDWYNGSTKLFKYVYDEHRYYTKGYINYVDVHDVARIVSELLKKDVSGERFILNAGRTTYEELFSLIARSFHKKPPGTEAGKFLSELAWRFEALRTMFSSDEPVLTRETARLSGLSYHYRNDKIKNLLGYNFMSLEESVSKTCGELARKYVNK